ncbi:carbohydrate ABC transporter permease [Cohnella phaseoli]|uniref:Maltose/maltodextrin transport system permease protein n=1 Tax=Cohnella phaseoli TaxID=456490 RepID=A0A3D9I8I9_9BACL|nr:sugar ABC transporter permease [Cohnella phaseoli]RED57476.1 carbohydrate ABC transporter membrane protein 1 (CUT1 family) [Cohnella phaseoli]
MRKPIAGALLSALFMGLGQLYHGQRMKGFLFLAAGIGLLGGAAALDLPEYLRGLWTLGDQPSGLVKVGKLTQMVEGDHSIFLLIKGLMALLAALLAVALYAAGIRDAYKTGVLREAGQKIRTFRQTLRAMSQRNFAYLVLLLPALFILFLTVLPLIFSILLAFTNYADPNLPPANLIDWVGFANFVKLVSLKVWSDTFFGVLLWTVIWAAVATATTYVGGILVAVLIHQPRIRFKAFWRTVMIVPFAIPSLISLLVMRNMFNNKFGPINDMLRMIGLEGVPWLTNPMWAKATLMVVNMWIGIPITMILAFGILTTIPRDLYEAAEVDGAGSYQKFRRITLPMMLFATAPVLIMQFAGNINNFNVIYLMTDGGPVNTHYQYAGHTDLLVTWLYKLALDQAQYSFASVIGIIIFLMIASLSIWSYRRTRSYKEEGMIA